MYKTALEKDLPAILKVAMGVGERGIKMAENVGTVVAGLQGNVQGMAKGGPIAMAGKLVACVAAPFQGGGGGRGGEPERANVSVSVEVKGSVSGKSWVT